MDVAAVSMSAHTGTHVDGAAHVIEGGPTAGAEPLQPLIGPARVVDARGRAGLDVSLLEDGALAGVERVLFRTRERVDAAVFPESIAAVEPELARRLAAAGVRLVGTDAPSVDPLESKTLDAHHVLLGAGVVVVENLVLDAVVPGDYTLIVLPLRLVEADSAPARAVLIEGPLVG